MIIGVLLVVFIANGCSAHRSKLFHIGIVSGTDDFLSIADGFKRGMADRGFVEGTTVVYHTRRFNADPIGELNAATALVREKVDLIFTFPTEPSVAAQTATQGTAIPVVFAYAGIEGSTLVESVQNPGGNITGVRFPGPELIARRLELLLEVAPQVKRIWIGYDREYPNTAPALAVLRPLAVAKGVTLVEVAASTMQELCADLETRAGNQDVGVDAIILMPDTFNHSPDAWTRIRGFASDHKVIIAGSFLYTVEQGAVFGNANDLYKVGEQAASQAIAILNGTPAGTLPVLTPNQELWINYRAAQELGLTVPEGVLRMAAQVIR
jgi:putative ABC transport system substrate-binding protein